MIGIGTVLRESVRAARRSWRALTVPAVGAAVAGCCATAMPVLAAPVIGVAVAVVATWRRTAPARDTARDAAWAELGASRSLRWALHTTEVLLVTWGAAAAGILLGLTFRLISGGGAGRAVAATTALLALLAGAAALPGPRRTPPRAARITRWSGTGARIVAATLTLAAAWSVARSIRTDFELAIGGALVVGLVTLAAAAVTGDLARLAARPARRIPATAAAAAVASRTRVPLPVRLVLAVAVSVTAGTAILGASLERRPETRRAEAARLGRLPVLPPEVALVGLEPADVAAFDRDGLVRPDDRQLPEDLPGALAGAVPGAEVVPLHHVSLPAPFCLGDCVAGPVVVSEPRLARVYGPVWQGDAHTLARGPERTVEAVPVRTRVPTIDQRLVARRAGTDLPRASFSGVGFWEVPAEAVLRLGLATRVRSVLVVSPAPLGPEDRAALAQVADRYRAGGTPMRLVLPDPAPDGMPEPATLRDVPWAATSSAARWGNLALAVAVGAALVAGIAAAAAHRRDDALPAPWEARDGVVLAAGMHVAVSSWFAIGVTAVLIRGGVAAFNRARPEMPIPFAMPWDVLVAMAVALPVAVGIVAAAAWHLAAPPARVPAGVSGAAG